MGHVQKVQKVQRVEPHDPGPSNQTNPTIQSNGTPPMQSAKNQSKVQAKYELPDIVFLWTSIKKFT